MDVARSGRADSRALRTPGRPGFASTTSEMGGCAPSCDNPGRRDGYWSDDEIDG